MTNSNTLTASNIRYLLTMKELDGDGRGVRCIALATALGLSKPSVHNMMGTFSQMGLISRDSYGAAFFTDEGNELTRRYSRYYAGVARLLRRSFPGMADVREAAYSSPRCPKAALRNWCRRIEFGRLNMAIVEFKNASRVYTSGDHELKALKGAE